MKAVKYASLFLVALFAINRSYAQMIPDPSTWKIEVKNKGGNKYQVVFNLSLKDTWHVYAKTKGMDESLIVPSFSFDKNADVVVSGAPTVTGKLVTKNIEGVGKVSMYSGKITYIQNITAKKGTKITGSYTYQTCNDNTCLPPKTKQFSVVAK